MALTHWAQPGIPIAYFFTSVAFFYLTVLRFGYPKSCYSYHVSPVLFLASAWLSFSKSNYFHAPLDNLWAMLLTTWASHSISVLWLETPLITAAKESQGKVFWGLW